MKKSVKNQWFVLILILTLNGCSKTNKFSEIPNVTFKEFIQHRNVAGKDSAFDFIFTFQDGDGDLGYLENEFFKCGIPENNLFIYYELKQGNTFVPKLFLEHVYDTDANCDTIAIRDDSLQLDFPSRMTYIQPSGSDKSIEGIVSYAMSETNVRFLFNESGATASGRFRFYILDRAGHKSNEEYTGVINLVR